VRIVQLSLAVRLASVEGGARSGLEMLWTQLLRPTVTRTDYVATLLTSYGFIAPLESACRYTPGVTQLLETRHFTNAGLLAQDLLAMGLTPSRLTRAPQCRALATFGSLPEALGWLYVTRQLARIRSGVRSHLVATLSEAEHACAYLAALDSAPWGHFDRVIEDVGADLRVAADIAAAATIAFEWATRWVEEAHEQARVECA
jgi:heme oxygenase